MKIARQTYTSPLRKEQAELTRDRILKALSDLLEPDGSSDAVTFKSVAEKAGITEMTVYRHFPTRHDLFKGHWSHMTAQMGPTVGMPRDERDLTEGMTAIHEGFDKIPGQIMASISTPQGQEIRSTMNETRRKAYLACVESVGGSLIRKEKTQAAAIIQMLQSAYAWASMKEQWNFSGQQASEA